MRYLMGIDLGTSGTKTVIFTEGGAVTASAMAEYPILQPQNGWAEQDPDTWWDAVQKTVPAAIKKAGINAAEIAGVGIAGQMHGLVAVDRDKAVVRNAILWCDGRTSAECAQITERVGRENLIRISANPALTGFTAGKLLWVRNHEPERYARIDKIMLPKDYIRFKLTGTFGCEVSDASGTNLFDVPNRCWSEEILTALEIPQDFLPPVTESQAVVGAITEAAARKTGLAVGTPVVAGAGDNAAAAVGTGVTEKGKALVTIGTSGVIFAHSERVAIDPLGRVHTFCHAVPGAWTMMSCTLSAGMSLQWFRNNFCGQEIERAKERGTDPYKVMDEEAAEIPVGADGLVYLPYLMGERSPLLDENARGVFFGLSGRHTRAHLVRAVMEGVAYSQRQCLEVLEENGVRPDKLVMTGGGSSSGLWRGMIADNLGCAVLRSKNKEGPAAGAAILAGVGVGAYADVHDACARWIKKEDATVPDLQKKKQYDPYFEIYKKLYSQNKILFEELREISG